MNTAMTMNQATKFEKTQARGLLRRSVVVLLSFGWATLALAGGAQKTQEVLLADALIQAESHYCSVVNHSTRNIEFTIAIWSETGTLKDSGTYTVVPGQRIQIGRVESYPEQFYCTVTYTGQKSEARAAHCGFTEVPNTYDFSSQACLPLD